MVIAVTVQILLEVLFWLMFLRNPLLGRSQRDASYRLIKLSCDCVNKERERVRERERERKRE